MTAGLAGKVAFITGIARGQGRAHAVKLAAEGCDIVGVDICAPLESVKYRPATPDDLAETVALVEKQGGRIVAEIADVRELDQLERAVAKGWDEFGRLDIVVANAGISTGNRVWEITPEQWRDMIDVNLTGVWHTVKATVPRMIEQGTGGSIILVSSVGGLRGLPFCGHYTAAKHGVVGLCRTLANELGEYDIRCNSVHPTGVQTEMINDPDIGGLIAASATTLGPIFAGALPQQILQSEDVANVVAFLASDQNRYMTGAQIPIDLGTLGR